MSVNKQHHPPLKELRIRNMSSSSVYVLVSVRRAHTTSGLTGRLTEPICGIHHPQTHTPCHNSEILSWICVHHSVFLTVRSFPHSEPQSHLGEDL